MTTSADFQFRFDTLWSPQKLFDHLIDPRQWWIGLYGEDIQGQSQAVGDEFTFSAGNGVHYSRQKLVEIIPNRRIVWEVLESNLSFLAHPNEWAGTSICFDIQTENDKSTVTFSHKGLIPGIECYDQCSSAWTQYLQNLSKVCG